MRRMSRPYIAIWGVVVFFFFLNCHKKNPVSNSVEINYTTDGRPALLLVMENNNWLGGGIIETGFEMYRDKVLPIFSELFDVPVEDMQNLTLVEIVDIYGEAWQINEILAIAIPNYENVIVLTDRFARSTLVLDTLAFLCDEGYDIDLMFNMHGDSESIWFADGLVDIQEFTQTMQNENIFIRALYQTMCYGSDMIDEWEDIDIITVNGAKANNSFVIFSPIYFMELWVNGATFKDAVQTAYEMEIEKLESYQSTIPISQFLVTSQIKKNSVQKLGGLDKNLLWVNYPII